MSKRFLRVVSAVAVGCSFQLAGCESQQITEIVASALRDTAVDVGTFVIESVVDNALGLPQ